VETVIDHEPLTSSRGRRMLRPSPPCHPTRCHAVLIRCGR